MKQLYLLMFLLIISLNIYTVENENKERKLNKRKVLILPFYNTNEVEKYQYLSSSLRDALNAELLKTNLFLIIGFGKIDEIIQKNNIGIKEAVNENNSYQIASELKADVIVIGTYIILEDKIKLQIKAIDNHEKQTAVSINIQGDVGLDIFRIIDDSSKQMAEKMAEKLRPMSDDYFKEQRKIMRQKLLTSKVRVGIGLTAGGGSLMLIGLGILIYDVAGYSSVVQDNLYNNPRTDIGYQEYLKVNYTHIALLAVSISCIGLGTALLGVGLPLMIYDIRMSKKKLSFHIDYKENLNLYFKFML